MNSETRICQNCKTDFTIEPDDFGFYEKIKVPPPTFCPECRLQRRLAWMPSIVLFKRKCDLCKEETFSMYTPDAPFVVYCQKCWWSDNWDPLAYGVDVDFSKPFLKQWQELLQRTPILGLSVDIITGKLSPYTNHVGNSKNCYMIFYSDYNENGIYGYQLTQSKDVLNSATVLFSDNIFDSQNVFKCYNLIGSFSNNRSCFDSFFIRDCEGAHHCFGGANIKNGSHIFLGEKLSKEDYENKIKNIELGSYKQYLFWREKSNEYFKKNLPQPIWDTQSVNVTGSYVFRSKNCKNCFDVTDCEDSKYLMLIKEGPVRDSYDYTDWGLNSELIYESITVGDGVSNIKFSHESGHSLKDTEYSKLSTGGSYHFGCISVKKAQYCILNKQYTKEEYSTLVVKIKKHMNDMPYIDKKGNVYKYGEFFPMEFSPHAYNNSFANLFFPKDKNEILKDQLNWYEVNTKEYPITMSYLDLPDNIKETNEEIIKEIISCSTCLRGYKIIKEELDLARKLNVPLSRQCPFCRIEEKVRRWVSQMKQIDRICDKCGNVFKTHYTKEDALIIYCKKCYQQEVY